MKCVGERKQRVHAVVPVGFGWTGREFIFPEGFRHLHYVATSQYIRTVYHRMCLVPTFCYIGCSKLSSLHLLV